MTFFLAWTAIENGYSMGGVWESYGEDFLDVLDENVNGPEMPEEFQIQFRTKDGRCYEKMALDFVYDANNLRGQIELLCFLAISILISRKYTFSDKVMNE